ncbi:TPA: Alw26I/Eco31I/Esp3I family type II restriction endonuclease [Campylobacter coli]|nr:Alw26I/Eco31I/Esp3I family type II restriction endonuclease [Campylobacter coli]HEB9355708.1 Alw26I/Eco31I/Esp3I family type II restriction endonuclease [Campylobacter coli]
MARNTKLLHPHFIKYKSFVVNHQNYSGLPIKNKNNGEYSWLAPANTEMGKDRIKWCINKAYELKLIGDISQTYPGIYADVMLEIHPTKCKVCQICGNCMSLFYHYPSKNFLKSLNNTFNSHYTICDHISFIWDDLMINGVSRIDLASFFIEKGDLKLNPQTATKDEIIDNLEYVSRKGNKKCLSPGAMSNFPDRFDGFHSYNRCCRETQDLGRSQENLKTYTKDRRAYEYWSDGNIHAANQFMGSSFFSNGISADHIGPISLGFIHDPLYLQPMLSGENSSKRDRLTAIDIENITRIQNRTGVCPISWYSVKLWNYIQNNYKNKSNEILLLYRDMLKQNVLNFMFILYSILTLCPKNGENFLIQAYIKPKRDYFNWDYSFNNNGEVISRKPRHFTVRNKYEFDRYKRIALESVFEYNKKDNRKNNHDLNSNEYTQLFQICQHIEANIANAKAIELLNELMEIIQIRLIKSISN